MRSVTNALSSLMACKKNLIIEKYLFTKTFFLLMFVLCEVFPIRDRISIKTKSVQRKHLGFWGNYPLQW